MCHGFFNGDFSEAAIRGSVVGLLHHICTQLWPVQSGSRVAAIPVGKGCRLLYASHGPFTTSTPSPLSESSGKLEQKLHRSEQERLPRVRDNLLILFPDGSIATVSIPFPALVRYIVNANTGWLKGLTLLCS